MLEAHWTGDMHQLEYMPGKGFTALVKDAPIETEKALEDASDENSPIIMN